MRYKTTQTAAAAAFAAELGRSWVKHLRHCPTCRDAKVRHAWHLLCDDGYVIFDDKRYADARVREERQADAAPIPGQEGMF